MVWVTVRVMVWVRVWFRIWVLVRVRVSLAVLTFAVLTIAGPTFAVESTVF